MRFLVEAFGDRLLIARSNPSEDRSSDDPPPLLITQLASWRIGQPALRDRAGFSDSVRHRCCLPSVFLFGELAHSHLAHCGRVTACAGFAEAVTATPGNSACADAGSCSTAFHCR